MAWGATKEKPSNFAATLMPRGASFWEEGEMMGMEVNSASNWEVSMEDMICGTKGGGRRQ